MREQKQIFIQRRVADTQSSPTSRRNSKLLSFFLPVLLFLCSLSFLTPAWAIKGWSIGIYTGSSPLALTPAPGIDNPVMTAREVTDIAAKFVADPFLLYENDNWYMFFEVLDTSDQGNIGYATSNDGLSWTYQGIVLDEPFHISYPSIFEWQGEHYLIPESFNDSSVRLYRASSFPTNWELVGRLISGRPYVDPSIIYHDNTWWMFVANVFNNDTLYLFYADTLTGPWVEHPSSPIVTGNANIARPGGRVIDFNGRLLRFAQDGDPTYGNQVRAFEILDLTRTSYLEAEVIESPVLSASGNGWNADGMHHLDPVEVSPGNWLAVTDGFGDSYYWGGGLPQSGWSVEYVDSEELVGEDGAVGNAFDGDPSTLWVTQWYGGSPAHPHELQINLGGLYEVSGLRYLPRQDGGDNGRIRQYAIYVSTDGLSWGSTVASGTFPDTAAEQEVLFAPVPATHVRLVALGSYDGDPWTAVAELNVLGNVAGGNLSPDGVIDTPAGDLTIAVGESVDFGGTGTDPENDLPLSYRWSFGAGSGLSDVTVEDPGPVRFNTAGSFSVSFTVTDANGLADPTPDSRTIHVCTPPSVTIDQPAPPHLQTASSLFVSAVACLDPLSSGWGVRFSIRPVGGVPIAVIDDHTAPFETSFNGLGMGEYTVTATIIDDLGGVVGGPGSSAQATPVGVGDYYVGVGDSITLGLGDDNLFDNTSADGRNSLGGYEPLLNDQLTAAKAYPHTVMNEGVAGDTSTEGAALIASILASHPEAGFFLVQYGTNDAGIPLPSGQGMLPGQPGYAGSFKDNMQQIITQIADAGKIVYLAKAPYAKGSYIGRNPLIQQYNQVIDELIAETGIAVAAADFYTFFENNQSQYSDDLHPNGTGYQSMGTIWANLLAP
jgi:lysophospholipase L1-like esterase